MIRSIFDSSPDVLAQVMGLDASIEKAYSKEHLGAILAHQLQAPLVYDLGEEQPDAIFSTQMATQLMTFNDLLHHPRPPIELLKLTKSFAKHNLDPAEPSMPPEIARLLYYAAIVVAYVKHGCLITELKAHQLMRGVRWAIEQSWVDDDTRLLFAEGADLLESKPNEDDAFKSMR